MAALLLVAPQLLGGVFPWGIAITCALAAVAALLASRCRRIERTNSVSVPFDALPFVLLAWTALQLLPLPEGWVHRVAVQSWDAWMANARLLELEPPSWMPLSADPGSTRLEVAKGTAIVAAYFSGRHLRACGLGRGVIGAAAAAVVLMALVGFAHEIVLAKKVFGLYTPVFNTPRLLTPLLNENHLGGLMVLGVALCAGLSVDARNPQARATWAAGSAACGIACLMSMSRAGVVVLTLAIPVLAVTMVRRRGDLKVRTSSLGVLGAATLALLLVGGLVAGPGLLREFGYTHNVHPKPEAWAAALSIIDAHPVTGVGRGAFSALFVQHHGSATRFYYPENIIVQWVSEWGIPMSVLLLGALLAAIWMSLRQAKSAAYVGALIGVFFLGVHDLGDFALEMSGVAVIAAAAFGAALSLPGKRKMKWELGQLTLAGGLLALVGTLFALSMMGRDLTSLQTRVENALERESPKALLAFAERELRLHPAEPILALAAAEAAARSQSPAAAAWINRAQSVAPRWSAPHLTAARWLISLGKVDQAVLEVRAAETTHAGSAEALVCSLRKNGYGTQALIRAAPPGSPGAKFFNRAVLCANSNEAENEVLDHEALRRDPQLSVVARRQARRLINQGDITEAIDLLASIREPDQATRARLAHAHLRNGQPERGLEALRPVLASTSHPDLLRAAATIYAATGEYDAVARVGARMRAVALTDPVSLARSELFLGALYEKHGQLTSALRSYESAIRFQETPQTLGAVARTAERLGHRTRALAAYRRLCRLEQTEACAQAERLANAP
jgi:hypothetical protein